MTSVHVECGAAGAGWTCSVTVGDDAGATHHEVRVSAADLERFGAGSLDPDVLVRASFDFLLEREARESILRSFELPLIGRYFPEYPDEIVRRLRQ
jgi:hypothetical protein